jgi:hypothetical protein
MNLWYLDTIVVHNRRLINVVSSRSGKYTFLETAELGEQNSDRAIEPPDAPTSRFGAAERRWEPAPDTH